ncbi:MAG: adenylate/guanylate cyclase domain-containing protein, partial [Microcoleus sp.]
SKGYWQCDIAQARLTHASDVVEFMAAQLQKLPQETQDVLKLAACIGAQFDLDTLAVVSEELPEKTALSLWKALEEELILPIHENYKFFIPTEAQFKTDSISNPTYRFLHDRVQQAAYSLIPDGQKPATHLKVGQLLLQSSSEMEREEKLFDIVEHLNLGQELIAQANEREALAQLNLKAGQKARNSTAYAASKVYLQIGIELLTDNCWQSQYELTLNLYVTAAEVAYLNADFDGMAQIAAEVLQAARTILDKVKTYEILITAQTAQNKMLEAIAVGRDALAQLGVELPNESEQVKIDLALQSLTRQLQDRRIEELLNLPVMTDLQIQAAMPILGILWSPIIQAMPSLTPLLSSTMVSLSLQFGNSPASTMGYLIHGVVLCSFLGDVKTGYGFGKLALNLLDRFNKPEFKSQIMAVFSSWIQHHQQALRATIPIGKNGYMAGMETGDFLYAGYNLTVCFEGNLFGGLEIDTWEAELADYSAAFTQVKQYSAQTLLDMTWQTTKNFRETVSTPDCLIGQVYDETVMIPKYHQDNVFTAIAMVYTYKLMLAYFFGNYPAALGHIAQAKPYLMSVSGLIFFPIFHFYAALTHLALFSTYPEIEQAEIFALVETHQITLHQWAQNAPMNHLHKWYLVEAEKQRVLGNKAEAIDLYDRAISLAQENQFLNEEALANELAAKFYLEWGKEKFAKIYMIDAYYGYVQWGATAKVKDLETRYPQLLNVTQPGRKNTQTSVSMTTTGSGNHVDITAVMKASQAISGEILLDKLLSSLMKILIENAGAQRGYLILSSQEQLLIEAEGTTDGASVTVLQSILVDNCQELSSAIVNYVARTQESVVLDDAVKEGQFTNDLYIQKHQPKSILCVPLINQSQIVSIVYLENNLTAGAFTPERVELLKVLSGQAAISIQNSKLYTEVRESEKMLAQLNKAYERFVPSQFLQFLDKSSIIDVQLGDQVQLEMSVLFSDIRDFTTLSESMTPEDNFRFINSYLSRMEPVINQNNGFIDKYIGDAIMALFSGDANNAVNAGIAMLNRLFEYNQNRVQQSGYAPIQIGIGINTGSLMLGTVGGPNRMDGTVISDAVNLASRVEGLTKNYGVSLLITQETYSRLENPSKYAIRSLDTVKVKGKSEAVTVYEVFDCDRPEIKDGKLATLELFAEALAIYSEGKFAEAGRLFAECWHQNQGDRVAKIYWERCHSALGTRKKIKDQPNNLN